MRTANVAAAWLALLPVWQQQLLSVSAAGLLAQQSCSSASFDQNTDYTHNDLRTVGGVTSAAACCGACAKQPGCNAWTLWAPGDQCYLKTSAAGRRAATNHTSGNYTGPHPPGPPPGPPAPSQTADQLDCEMRSFFVERAAKVNSNLNHAHAKQMADALTGDPSLPAGCTVRLPTGLPARPLTNEVGAGSSETFFADSTKGSDLTGDGSLAKPYQSIQRVLEATRGSSHPAAVRRIILRGGTYFLSAPIELTAADSGLTIQTYSGDDTAWLSGAHELTGIHWERVPSLGASATGNIWSADLSSLQHKILPAGGIRSLRIAGTRGILARYPNCNPETQLCFEHQSTTTKAQTWLSVTSQNKEQRYVAPNGTSRHFCDDKNDRGCDVPYAMNHGGAGCDLLTPNISHFCGSSKVVGAKVNRSEAPHQPYADPAGAIFSAMHGGSWCSFSYEVSASDGYHWDPNLKQGQFTFGNGGQQCNRQEAQHGPLIIENVREELDTPGEFFFNRSTNVLTLWYNATAGIPPPSDGSIVAPLLTTLLAARGSQQAPVKGVSLVNIGIRDTAPTILFPHVGPSGGDWSINRFAAVVVEGVEQLSITGCNFTRLDNGGIFLGGYTRDVTIANNEFAWLGESAVVSFGDTDGGPVKGWGVDGTAGNQPRGTKLHFNYARELGLINKQSALYFQAVTDGSDIRGNVAFNGARSAINFNDAFGSGSNVTSNVLFNFNRETADHGPFNAWDRISFIPRKGPHTRDTLSGNAIWCNFHSANAFDTDDTSTYFHMTNNVQVGGWFLKSDFGGSEIEFERNMAINGGQSNQYQSIPPGNFNYVKNCTIIPKTAGENLQGRAPCPNSTLVGEVHVTRGPMPCNTTLWDEICPPSPSNCQMCEACCKAHTTELVNMNCDGPTSHWNYSWHDHCAGLPPPPWLPNPPPPPPSPTSPIQYSDVQIYIPEGAAPEQSTVCGKPISQWQQEGFLKTVSVSSTPSLGEIVRMAWAILDEST